MGDERTDQTERTTRVAMLEARVIDLEKTELHDRGARSLARWLVGLFGAAIIVGVIWLFKATLSHESMLERYDKDRPSDQADTRLLAQRVGDIAEKMGILSERMQQVRDRVETTNARLDRMERGQRPR